MKINLSKEHVEKGCGLLKDYHIDELTNRFVYRKGELDPTHADPSIDVLFNEVLYRDFLQLVIEAIEEKEGVIVSIWKDGSTYCYNVLDGCGDMQVSNCLIYHTRIEAKEKAIADVFDNMESDK